jgi:RND family efflux transporter MFP subunit
MTRKVLFVVVLFVMTSCGHQKEEDNTVKKDEAIKVKTEMVRSIKGNSELHYSGTIEPSQTIPLTFQSNGIVDNVMVQEGDMVRKGQVLAVVNKSDNLSMYQASTAKYQQAKDAYDRLKNVHDKGSLTEIKWVEMETNLKQAESQVQLAQSNLEKCTMRAPDNGMIGHKNIEPGQSSLSAGTPLELVKIESVFVKVAIPENEISKIRKGQTASFSISALDSKTFEGVVTSVGVVADKISRTYEVKISVKNDHLEIKPGMVCDVTLNAIMGKETVIVPYDAVTRESEGKAYVFILTSGQKQVKKQTIATGNYLQSGIEVLEGLTIGQTVVTEGKEKLSDNSTISL